MNEAQCRHNAQLIGVNGGSLVPNHAFHSEWHQDWAVAGVLQQAGILKGSEKDSTLRYVDLAANQAIAGSNTAFFDRCLGWKGMCVEPNPSYHMGISQMRSCILEKTCVNENGTVVSFEMDMSRGHIKGRRLTGAKTLHCSRLDALLRKQAVQHALRLEHIHFLSLDIEGAELDALRSVDWTTTTIDVMTVENAMDTLIAFVGERGGERALVPTLCVGLDLLFTRPALQGAAQQWYELYARHALPACITNDTAMCTHSKTAGKFQGGRSFLRCQRYHRENKIDGIGRPAPKSPKRPIDLPNSASWPHRLNHPSTRSPPPATRSSSWFSSSTFWISILG